MITGCSAELVTRLGEDALVGGADDDAARGVVTFTRLAVARWVGWSAENRPPPRPERSALSTWFGHAD